VKRSEIEQLRSATAADILADVELTKLLALAGVFIWDLTPSTCTRVMRRRIQQIHRLSKLQLLKIFDMQKSKYKLKSDVVLYSTAQHKHFTNANMTDEDAIRLVKESPKAVNSFEVAPTAEDLEPKTNSAQYSADECIALIEEAQDAEAVQFFADDNRVTVKRAAVAKLEALKPEPIITEDESPEATKESPEDSDLSK